MSDEDREKGLKLLALNDYNFVKTSAEIGVKVQTLRNWHKKKQKNIGRVDKVKSQITPEMRQCIKECQECEAICKETTMHCLQMGGKHADPVHIKTMLDCAEACQTAASFMARGSALHPEACLLCADACLDCAQSCDEIDPDDAVMRACAEACRRCEASCRPMAGTGHGRLAA